MSSLLRSDAVAVNVPEADSETDSSPDTESNGSALSHANASPAITFEKIGDPEIRTRIAQYEMAYRMQTSVPDLTDISQESENTLALYGEQVKNAGGNLAVTKKNKKDTE